jgi:hypothetical protein
MNGYKKKKIKSKNIIKQNPNIFGVEPFDSKKTLIGFVFDCEVGWNKLLINLISKISKEIKIMTFNAKQDNDIEMLDIIDKFKIVQIKEKFGSLRIYYINANHEIFNHIKKLIYQTELNSMNTCELCGSSKTVKLRNILIHNNYNYSKTLCNNCYKQKRTIPQIESKDYLISDTHFGHFNVIKFEPIRLEQSIENGYDNDIDGYLFDQWNSTITNNDTIIHLGDLYFDKKDSEFQI